MNIRQMFCKKVYAELLNFQLDLLNQEKEVIYYSANKIEVFTYLYEILIEHSKKESEATLMNLMYRKGSIMEFIYNGWMRKNIGIADELEDYVSDLLFAKRELPKVG